MKFSVPKIPAGSVPPMILISWIFGIGVFEYPMGKPRRMLSVFWSILNFLAYASLLKIANFSMIADIQGSKIAAHNHRVLNIFFCPSFVATSMCLAQINSKAVKISFRKMRIMNDRLKMLGIPDDHEVAFRLQIIQISAVFTFLFIAMVLSFVSLGFDLPKEMSRVGYIICMNYILVYAYIVDGNFSAGIRYFGNRFQRLNELLAESDSAEIRKTVKVTQGSFDQFARYSSVINEIHRNNPQGIRAAEKRWLFYLIKETRIIHREFCKMAMDMNKALGIQLLLSVTLSFGMMTAILYSAYVVAAASTLSNALMKNVIPAIVVLMWITFYAMKIILIVNACEITSCEANRTKAFISQLLNTAGYNEGIRNEMNTFSLQLIQNPLNFTACGFFPLNYSLVRGIAGSVTTYLIIMIQMRSIYEPGIENSNQNSTFVIHANDTN